MPIVRRAGFWIVAPAALSLLLPLPTGCRVTLRNESGCLPPPISFPARRQKQKPESGVEESSLAPAFTK